MPFTSTPKVKRMLGIPAGVTVHDEFIDEIVGSVDPLIVAYCQQPTLTQGTYVDTFDVDSARCSEVMLSRFPVSSITTVEDAGGILESTAYYVDGDTGSLRLTRSGSTFTPGKQKVKVTYIGGHADGSAELNTISFAAGIWAAALYNTAKHAGMKSEGLAGYRYSTSEQRVPRQVQSLLAPMVKVFQRDSQP